jgi:hypothetical protein
MPGGAYAAAQAAAAAAALVAGACGGSSSISVAGSERGLASTALGCVQQLLPLRGGSSVASSRHSAGVDSGRASPVGSEASFDVRYVDPFAVDGGEYYGSGGGGGGSPYASAPPQSLVCRRAAGAAHCACAACASGTSGNGGGSAGGASALLVSWDDADEYGVDSGAAGAATQLLLPAGGARAAAPAPRSRRHTPHGPSLASSSAVSHASSGGSPFSRALEEALAQDAGLLLRLPEGGAYAPSATTFTTAGSNSSGSAAATASRALLAVGSQPSALDYYRVV